MRGLNILDEIRRLLNELIIDRDYVNQQIDSFDYMKHSRYEYLDGKRTIYNKTIKRLEIILKRMEC